MHPDIPIETLVMIPEDAAPSRKALVLYGSETGNAHDVADELGRLTERLRFDSQVMQLDAVEPSSLPTYDLVVIAISTVGQGELPNNARLFWKKILRRRWSTDYLQNVNFTVFGLGDSSYPKYNWAARKLHRRLMQLGAKEVHPSIEADEQHADGFYSIFIPWSSGLRDLLLRKFPLKEGEEPIADNVLLQPKWILSANDHASCNRTLDITGDSSLLAVNNHAMTEYHPWSVREGQDILPKVFPDSKKSWARVQLEANRRLTPSNHWQDVRHLVFHSPQPQHFIAGDILTIYPENAMEDVECILALMGWKHVADTPVCFVHNPAHTVLDAHSFSKPAYGLTGILTLRRLLTNHLDLNAIPRRFFFSLMAHFTVDDFQKQKLLDFADPEFIDELYDYTTRPRRSILEVLQEFDSVKFPWQWAACILPELRGRQFSIANGGQSKSSDEKSTCFELLVAIVKYKTVIKKIRQGTCTRFLASLSQGTWLNVTLQKGGLGAIDDRRPVIMIGPGTGLAPMRSLIWERFLQIRSNEIPKAEANGLSKIHRYDTSYGQSVLFFGCRNRRADYFFEEEWKDLQHKMPLTVFTAFSRDQEQKIYVQDLIKQQGELVFRLICKETAIICVCGSSGKMPQAVREALIEVFRVHGDMDIHLAEIYLQTMEKENRYKQETW